MSDTATSTPPVDEPVLAADLPSTDGIIRVEGSRRTATPHNVELVGQDYRALPMKALVALELQEKFEEAEGDMKKTIAVLERWLTSVFGRTQTPGIMQRLKDPGDDLDLPDVIELLQLLMERSTGNPTSSSSD